MADLVHEKQSREIIGAAMTVLNELKLGLSVAAFFHPIRAIRVIRGKAVRTHR